MPESLRLIEVSWEVCNKVGGIHTVLTTKLPHALQTATAGYLAVGPYFPDQAATTLREEPLPEHFRVIADALEKKGVLLHYGRWLVPGEPEAVLLSWDGLLPSFDQIKADYWEKYQLDTMHTTYSELGQPLLWSHAVGMFVEQLQDVAPIPTLLHIHEWLSGGALLYLNDKNHPDLRSVFTTHATILGRSLTGRGDFIYDKLTSYQPDQEAAACGIIDKFQLERLSARLATVFTTVSEITADEATAFLGRRPDYVSENGIDLNLFPSPDELHARRAAIRSRLNGLCTALFGPQHTVNPDQITYQVTMGRYEFHNKGYDLYLESLARLNQEMIASNSSRQVVALFLVPGSAGEILPEISRTLAVHRLAESRIRERVGAAVETHLYNLWQGVHQQPECANVLTEEVEKELHDLFAQLPVPQEVPISPFAIDPKDSIVAKAAELGLRNRAEDRVKIIFTPIYLTGLDTFFTRTLYDIVCAADLAVFPSTYEPWGYTPMESLALGVPTITSSLAGFGLAIQRVYGKLTPSGVSVLNRTHNNWEGEATALTTLLREANSLHNPDAYAKRLSTYEIIRHFDWAQLYATYQAAYDRAFAA